MKENASVQKQNTEPSGTSFAKVYLIYLGVILALVLGVLIFLWVRLSAYQEGIDNSTGSDSGDVIGESAGMNISPVESEKAAQQYFTDYVNSLSVEDWIVIYRNSHPESADSDEDIAALINSSVLPAKSSLYKAADYDLSSPRYIMGTADNAVASFILEGFGTDWQIKECTVLASGDGSLTITAPKGCELIVNGSDSFNNNAANSVTEETVTLDGYEEDLINPVTMCTYTVGGLITDNPQIEIADSFLSLDGSYYCVAEDTDGLIKRADSFVKAMLNCYAQGKNNIDGNLSNALSYVDSSSPAAKIIRDTKSGLEWTPPDSSISLETQSHDLCIWADNCRFVEVTCASGSTYRVFFLDSGNGYKIVQFEVL